MNRRTYLAKGIYTDKKPRELLNVFIRSYHTHKYYAVQGTNVVYKTEKQCDGLVLLDKQVNIASWEVTNIINDVYRLRLGRHARTGRATT